MVVIKYKKNKEGIFFSPEETKKILDRLLSICGVDVKLKNNKKKIYFCSPSEVGIESKCEYVFIDSIDSADSVEDKLLNILPEWLEVEYIYDIEDTVNFEEVKTSALYEIDFDSIKDYCNDVVKFFEKYDDFLVEYNLDSCEVEEEKIEVITSAGDNGNKVIKLIKDILSFLEISDAYYKIFKRELYVNTGVNKIKDFDKLIAEIQED